MLLKEIGRKIAQTFRLARAADEKVASSIVAALDAKAVDRAAILQTPWRVVQKTRAVLQPERRDAI